MTYTPRLAPSLLSADQTDLRSAIDACAAAGITTLHLDVMDGHYVPNLSFGTKVARDITRYIEEKGYTMELDIHLMVTEPDELIGMFATAGPAYLTVHVEAVKHIHRSLQLIREHGIKPGVSLNPATPITHLEELYDEIELILLMTVNPGFGGQSFIKSCMDKIHRLRNELVDRGRTNIVLEVDGGVNVHNVAAIAEAGAELLVVGSATFSTAGGATVAGNLAALHEALGITEPARA